MTKNQKIFLFVFLGALVMISHGLSLKAQFMIDDFSFVDRHQRPAQYQKLSDFFTKTEGHHFSPFDVLINVTLFKIFPKPLYHYGLNLLLFYGNLLLLFFLVRNLTKNDAAGAMTAVLFAVHPANAEILSHISTINSVLLSAAALQGSLIAFYHYHSHRQENPAWLFLSLILFIVALLCIETSLLFPLTLGFLSLMIGREERMKLLRMTIPFWFIALGYLGLWSIMAGPGGHWSDKIQHLHLSFFNYTATLSYLLKWYVGNLFFPENFVLIKNSLPLTDSVRLWNTGLALSLVLIFFMLWKWKGTAKSFALGWFVAGFVFMLPASIVHAYSMGMVIEPHWFSSMGFFMLLALIITEIKTFIQPVILSALLFTIISYWGITSFRHHAMAQTQIGYLQYWLKNSPRNLLPSLMLGQLYGNHPDLPIPHELFFDMKAQSANFITSGQHVPAQRLLERLLKMSPDDPDILLLQAINLANENRFREALNILTANPNPHFLNVIEEIKELEQKKP